MAAQNIICRPHTAQDAHVEAAGWVSTTWRDTSGRPYTAGDVTEGGLIVPASPGRLISSGVVWIAKDKLADAARYGWEANGIEAHGGDLLQVARA